MSEEYKKKIEKLKQELLIMKTLNIKPNYSELSRIYKLDRRTIEKYNNGYSKSEIKRNRKSKLDKYYDEIKEKGYSLSAGQYFDIKIEYIDITEEEFKSRMKMYKQTLTEQFAESRLLEEEIMKQLDSLQFNANVGSNE